MTHLSETQQGSFTLRVEEKRSWLTEYLEEVPEEDQLKCVMSSGLRALL